MGWPNPPPNYVGEKGVNECDLAIALEFWKSLVFVTALKNGFENVGTRLAAEPISLGQCIQQPQPISPPLARYKLEGKFEADY